MSYKIGLTGGIGSGKSTVAYAFSKLGVCVFSADEIGHELSRKGNTAYHDIIKVFGQDYLQENGELNRAHLGDLVFKNEKLKEQLEDILHPLIMQTIHQRADASVAPYVVLDIPLLIGTPEQNRVDRILVIDCQQSTRIRRIKKRSGWSDEKIRAAIAMQLPEKNLLDAANDIIDNNQSTAFITRQVENLHMKYLKLARKNSG